MAKKTRYSKEEKEKLIKHFKPFYLSSKRAKIGGKPVTEEVFDKLSLKDQWSKIYINYLRSGEESSRDSFNVTSLKEELKTFKSKIDDLDDKIIEDVFKVFEELKGYYSKKSERTFEKRKKEAEQKLEAAKKELERLNAEQKNLK